MWKSAEDWEAIEYAVKGVLINLLLLLAWVFLAIYKLHNLNFNFGR